MRLRILTQVCIISILTGSACSYYQSQGTMPITSDSEAALEFYRTGMMAYDEYRFNVATDNLKKAVEEDHEFFMANFMLYFLMGWDFGEVGATVMKSGASLNEAEQQIKSAFKYLVDGFSEKALEHFENAVDMYPGDPDLYKILIIYQIQYLKDIDNGLKSIRRAIEANGNDGFAYNYLGYALMDLDRFKEAEEAFDHYIRLEPDLANPYDSKGDFFRRTGQYEEAYESYMKAYEIDPLSFGNSERKAQTARKMQMQPEKQ